MIRRAAGTARYTARAVPVNRPPDDGLLGDHHPDSLQREWRQLSVGSSKILSSKPPMNRSFTELRLQKQLAEDAL